MKLLLPVFLFLICFTSGVAAQPDTLVEAGSPLKKEKKKSDISLFDFLSSDPSITKVILTTDVNGLMDNRFKDYEVSSKYSFVIDGQQFDWSVKISPRGKSRKKICSMPPYLLNFSKDDLKKAGLEKKHDKLKMVNTCQRNKKYQYYLLREYLVYRIYNIITENSFNVKLLDVTYVDAENDLKPARNYSFLIEDTDAMADRLKSKEISGYGFTADSCSAYEYGVLSVFQYMISNTDWNLSLSHNTKFLKKKKSGKVIPVPYDFDYSGLVNAEYSVPNPDFAQYGVRHRIYTAEYPGDEEMEKIIALFLEKENEIIASIQGFDLLGKGWRKDMLRYIGKFYKELENPEKFKKICKEGYKKTAR